MNDAIAQKFQFATESSATTAQPPANALDDYASSREVAGQNLMLRVVYCAMQERIFADDTVLSVTQGDEVQQLHSSHEIYDYLYTRDETKPVQLSLNLHGIERPMNELNSFMNGVLREEVIAQVPEASQNANWLQFQYEIADSLNHEALAITAKRSFAKSLEQETQQYDNMFEWMKENRAQQWMQEHNHDTDSFLLQLGAFNGHPTHPSSKMRLLLDPERKGKRHAIEADEAQQVFPEFAPDVPLQLYAVKAERATSNTSTRDVPQGYREYMRESFPEEFGKWEEAVDKRHGTGAAAEYIPIPVHPLQTRELEHRFAAQMGAAEVIAVPEVTISQRPTISTRTLTPVDNDEQPQIKTSLNMQMTSVVRTIAPARAYNSPVYSDVVGEVVANDDSIRPNIRPLMEQATAYYGTDASESSQDYQDGYQLSAVFKQNPAQLTHDGEIRMPVAAMLRESPFSGKPVLADIMRSAGVGSAEDAKDYLRDYVDIVVRSEVGLLARYGIGLEGHQQNNDMIFDAASGRPKTSVYRDINGGVEANEPVLKMNGYDMASDMHPVKKGLYDDVDLPLQQTMHTTFHSHLFPMVAVIAKEYDIPQTQLYQQIRESVEHTLGNARDDHMPKMLAAIPQAEREDAQRVFEKSLDTIGEALLSRDMETKCLLSMRLAQSQSMKFSHSRNPISIG